MFYLKYSDILYDKKVYRIASRNKSKRKIAFLSLLWKDKKVYRIASKNESKLKIAS